MARQARSPFDRRRWNEEDAREVLAALDRSGQSVSAFAAEHGLDTQRVYLWRRRLRGSSAGAERSTFREVIVRPRPSVLGSDAARFEIVLGSGMTVRVPPSFDADALGRLLDVLARAGAC
jgi:transposase